jgi:hypothetical protein
MKIYFFFILLFTITSINANEIKYSISSAAPKTGETLKIFFFSRENSRVSLAENLIDTKDGYRELQPGLLLISSIEKEMDIDGISTHGIELQIKSYKAGTVTIPEINFVVETRSGLTSSTQAEISPAMEIEFESGLKEKKLSPLLGKITAFEYKKQLPLILLTLLLLFCSYILWKILRNLINKLSEQPLPKPQKINIRQEMLNLKDSEIDLKRAYYDLSNLFKLSIERRYLFLATHMHSEKIIKSLIASNAEEHIVKKIRGTFKSLRYPKFSNPELKVNHLNSSVDTVVGIIDEF